MKVESSVVTDLPCRVREWVQGNEKVQVFGVFLCEGSLLLSTFVSSPLLAQALGFYGEGFGFGVPRDSNIP